MACLVKPRRLRKWKVGDRISITCDREGTSKVSVHEEGA